MKSKSKSEIALAAGISYSTFRRWLQGHRDALTALGIHPYQKLLPPRAVRYICDELGIHEEDFL